MFEESINVTVAQLGELKRAEIDNALGIASNAQRSFEFDSYPERLPLDRNRYMLPNSGIDLEAAALDLFKEFKLPRPLILITSAPFTDHDHGSIPKYFFISGGVGEEDTVAILSTYVWEHLPGKRPLEPFVLYHLGQTILDWYTDLYYHHETRGCLFDYCDNPKDLDRGFELGPLCDSCEQSINDHLRRGPLNMEEFTSVKKLYNKAAGRKVCFVVMPFKRELRPIYDAISVVLRNDQWIVQRADEIGRPRRITDAIMQAILSSDLIVADLTGNNPNVFYEVGIAHAIGCDVILLTQGRKIPFDVTTERAIIYKNTPDGMQELASNLQQLARRNKL